MLLIPLTVTAIEYLAECDLADAQCLRKALQLDGAVAATQVPGMAQAREDALLAVAGCTSTVGPTNEHVQEMKLNDGTSRLSLGTKTLRGVPEPLRGCEGIGDATAAMRALVDQGSRRFLQAVQPLQRTTSALLAEGGKSYATLEAVADAGEQLEHFHTYRSAAQPDHAMEAVPMHTDAGLFIAIVPALYAAPAAKPSGTHMSLTANPEVHAEEGFVVQRWDGSTMKVAPTVEASALIFVIGDGWGQWLNPQLSTPLRAAPHQMAMPHTMGNTAGGIPITRIWYGRMYLPPSDAVLHPGGRPFAEWRHFFSHHPPAANSTALTSSPLATDMLDASLPVGCAGGRRFLTSDDSCGANKIFCWHKCVSVQHLACGEQAICWSVSESRLWTPDQEHCTSCEATCTSPSPPPPAPPNSTLEQVAPYERPFCTGPGTDMHMSGFVFAPADCTILLFREWTLTSAGAFAGGVIGTFLLGITTEALTWWRRTHLSKAKALQDKPAAYRGAMALAFTVQVMCGYFLMLIAMTYQAELFIGVIVGLGCGHFLFNVTQPVGTGGTDPCCVEAVEEPVGAATATATITTTNGRMGGWLGSKRSSSKAPNSTHPADSVTCQSSASTDEGEGHA